MAKPRSRSSKSARRRADKHARDRDRVDAMGNVAIKDPEPVSSGSGCRKRPAERPRVEIPEPHPAADPNAALNAIAEYRAELKRWQNLPIWKRLVTPKPQHPVGV